MTDAPGQANVIVRFVLTVKERDTTAEAEAAAHGDMLFTDTPESILDSYRSIVYKTYFVLEYAVSSLSSHQSVYARVHARTHAHTLPIGGKRPPFIVVQP